MKVNPSIVVNSQAPEFIRSDYAKFITFLQKYYEYLEQSGKALDLLRNLETYNDIDVQTNEEVLSVFYSLFLPDFPQSIVADKKFVLKHIAEFYNSKGSYDSIKAFFRMFYGEEVSIYLPKIDILKLDAGIWNKVFKVRIQNLSAGTIQNLVNSEIYQINDISREKTVRARVIDYDPATNTLFLTADTVIIKFSSTSLVYATNADGTEVTFNLLTQLGEVATTYSGINYQTGDLAPILGSESNTEDIRVQQVKTGPIENIIINSAGVEYSIFDEITFTPAVTGERSAKAKITETINNTLVSEFNDVRWVDPDDKFLFEDSFEVRQESGSFGSQLSTPNNTISDETTTNVNTGSISSSEFGILTEDQNDDSVVYSRGSYTYNQGLYRPLIPRIGTTANYALNYARTEGISVALNDEDLIIGSLYCTQGTPPDPGTVIIIFDTETDYVALDRWELTERTSSVATSPQVGVVNVKSGNEVILDSKIGGVTLQQQIGLYDFGENTLSPLYPFCENNDSNICGPIVYIRERNTLHGHDLNTTRPWEYRFIFKKGTTPRFKIYIMPVQYDLRCYKILLEDGDDMAHEDDTTSCIFLQEYAESTVKRMAFDPSNVSSNQITVPNHGFKQNEIIRYDTFSDIEAGITSDTVGGIINGEIFYCEVVNSNTIKLIPFGATNETINYKLFRNVTPAATSGTTCYFSTYVGAHVTNGTDYTHTAIEQSAISIYARRKLGGNRDLTLKYNIDPNTPIDSDTGQVHQYPYTVDNKIYLFQAVNEFTDYIKMERDTFNGGDYVAIEQEIDKRTDLEKENYTTYPYIVLESSETSVVQYNEDILIPDYVNARVMVQRKSLQTVDDISRGSERLQKTWNDYADISPSQELYCIADTNYADEYSSTPYNTAVIPKETSSFVSGPSEFANYGSNLLVASSKNNSVYYSDGTGNGQFRYASEFNDQRRISFFETAYHDSFPQFPTARNGPLGITANSQGGYNTNSKRYYTINFTLPEELNANFDIPFEVNLTNIVDSCNTEGGFSDVDFYEYISLEGTPTPNESVLLLEGNLPDQVALEFNKYGFNSIAAGKISNNHPNVMLEFFSPSLALSDPKKHLVFYCNKAEYLRISSDVQRSVYSFFNCWSPVGALVPDTTVRDYNVVIRSLVKSEFIIEKMSDTQLLTADPDLSVAHNAYVSPFVKDVYVTTGLNEYGKYLKLYPTYEDSVAGTNILVPFSLGSDFGSQISGNELFYNPVTSGTIVNSAFNNPLSSGTAKSPFQGLFVEKSISIARYFDPITDVGTAGSDSIIVIPNHGFVSGSWVRFRSDFNDTRPDGLTDNTTYYVNALTVNTIRLASSKANYDSNIWVSFTVGLESGKTCSLQTIPQSLSYGAIKENSFDAKQYVNTVSITGIDTADGTIFTATDNTLTTLNPIDYRCSDPTKAIGGLISGKQYFAIFASTTTLKLAGTKEDAINGIVVELTGFDNSVQHYIDVKGSNGNYLYNTVNKEQVLYTAGQYTNFLKTGDRVSYRSIRRTHPGLAQGATMYVKDSTTGSAESLTLTTNTDLSSIFFGTVQVLSSNIDTGLNQFTSTGHIFYTGEQLLYNGSTGTPLSLSGTLYTIRTGANTFKVATSFENAINGIPIAITNIGTGTHYFASPNYDSPSEITEIVPYSSEPNLSAVINPGVTGTGYEEFTISFASSLQTETGIVANIEITDPGSYYTVPDVTVTTYGNRTGSGVDLIPIVNRSLGAISSYEILDGGTHAVSRTLRLPHSFLSGFITGTFQIGETILIGSTEVGTLLSKRGHYFKVKQNSVGTPITLSNMTIITGAISGATAYVGRPLVIKSALLSDGTTVITTYDTHYLANKDLVYIASGLSPITSGNYYASVTGPNTFRLYTDRNLLNAVTLNVGSGLSVVMVTGLFTASASASPKPFTISTESGAADNYSNDKNLINTTTKLQDSYYYQDYSYVVRGSNSNDNWKEYFNKLVHPAGMAVFGEVDYFTESTANELLGNTALVGSLINSSNEAIASELVTSAGLIDAPVDGSSSGETVFGDSFDAGSSSSVYSAGSDSLLDGGSSLGVI
jgi:hypothetical protein